MKLKPEIKERWVGALLSDEFKQGKSRLTTEFEDGEVRHCCLGVLCELAQQDGVVDGEWNDINQTSYYGEKRQKMYFKPGDERRRSLHAVSYLPEAVIEWAFEDNLYGYTALDTPHNPRMVIPAVGRVSLGDLNDSYDYTFEQIASVVKEHL